jgi:aminoglycoside phosphotransferase family enzyme/predicted kinase
VGETARHESLVRALGDPSLYPHQPPSVEVRQTHISWIFLAGDFVYKLKKPVRFPFVDYSTRELRRRWCLAEVELNRRLAPATYLGVALLRSRGGGVELGAVGDLVGDGEDSLVVMRRLAEEEMLDRRLARGTAGAVELDRVAWKLAEFHARSAERGDPYGLPATIEETVCANLSECTPFTGDTVSESRLASLEAYVRSYCARSSEQLWRRFRQGRIRDGHGDLRAEHVCLAPRLEIFDCIEFSERLRSIDVASEIAFLAMDLEFLGHPLLAEAFAASYARASGDGEVIDLLPFYECYRAVVRGKVESLRSREAEVEPEGRRQARSLARRYFRIAARFAAGPRRPELIVVCGLAGSGKSTAARFLGDVTGFAVASSDVVRKDLAGLPRFAHPDEETARTLYGADFTRRTYEALGRQADEWLRSGRGVVLDATFRDPSHRRAVTTIGDACGAPVVFVECRAPENRVRERLRSRSHDVSDATEETYLRQRAEGAALLVEPPARHFVLDTGGDAETVADELDRRFAKA